jgi:hypothetical protein
MGDLHFSFIYQSPLILCYILTTNSSALTSNTSTFIITGRKRALREAYNRSLNVKYSYYCIIESYKPFLALLQDQVYRRGGSSYIITNIEKETFQAIKDLTEAGAEIKHIDISSRPSVCIRLMFSNLLTHFSFPWINSTSIST